jgi:hypothetical protein
LEPPASATDAPAIVGREDKQWEGGRTN